MAGIMLVAFTARALIPAGFMPASDRPLSLEICWEDFPAAVLGQGEPAGTDSMGSMDMDSMSHAGLPQGAHHHHSPHSEHCVFGSAGSAGPATHLPLLSEVSCTQELRAVAFVSRAGAVRLVHLPQPRAPPGQLS